MDKPVNGVPSAIRFPYASFVVIVNTAISPGVYEALSQDAAKVYGSPEAV